VRSARLGSRRSRSVRRCSHRGHPLPALLPRRSRVSTGSLARSTRGRAYRRRRHWRWCRSPGVALTLTQCLAEHAAVQRDRAVPCRERTRTCTAGKKIRARRAEKKHGHSSCQLASCAGGDPGRGVTECVRNGVCTYTKPASGGHFQDTRRVGGLCPPLDKHRPVQLWRNRFFFANVGSARTEVVRFVG
jgi:hypothetical protein